MNIQIKLQSTRIKISEPLIDDTYYIEQADCNNRFYITSEKGYDGHDGKGLSSLEGAIKHVKKMIKDHFINRCEDNPEGW